MVTARGRKKKEEEDEGMKFNLGDKLVMKRRVNVRGLTDPRVRGARAKEKRVEMKGREQKKKKYVDVCAWSRFEGGGGLGREAE